MAAQLDLWGAFLSLDFWWLDAMVFVWLVFTATLFVAEPVFLHRWLHDRASAAPEKTFSLVAGLHWALLFSA